METVAPQSVQTTVTRPTARQVAGIVSVRVCRWPVAGRTVVSSVAPQSLQTSFALPLCVQEAGVVTVSVSRWSQPSRMVTV